jgi:hypothetical protein
MIVTPPDAPAYVWRNTLGTGTDEPKSKELRKLLAIVVGLLAGLTGLVVASLATAVQAALSPVLGLYRSIAGTTVTAETARGSASTGTRSDRDAEVIRLSEGRGRDVEGSRLAA